jgi:hypothetical protein
MLTADKRQATTPSSWARRRLGCEVYGGELASTRLEEIANITRHQIEDAHAYTKVLPDALWYHYRLRLFIGIVIAAAFKSAASLGTLLALAHHDPMTFIAKVLVTLLTYSVVFGVLLLLALPVLTLMIYLASFGLFLLAAFLMFFIDRGASLTSLYADFVVDSAPTGIWKVSLHKESNENVGLYHSAVYQSPAAIESVLEWIRLSSTS